MAETGAAESGAAELTAAGTLEADRLSVRLGGTEVLHGVSAAFRPGQLCAVIGPNGAGKSTLLRALLGLEAPSGGEVRLDGVPLARLGGRARARQLAYLAQDQPLPEGLPVRDVVALGRGAGGWLWGLLPLGAGGADDEAAVTRAMRRTGILPFAERLTGELSGGERQRVGLARALAADPRFLLLDEPNNHLDLAHGQALISTMRAEVAAGLGVVAVLHDLSLAAQADTLLLLHAGRLLAQGPPQAVLTPPLLRAAYGLEVEVLRHRGRLLVVPLEGALPDEGEPDEGEPDEGERARR